MARVGALPALGPILLCILLSACATLTQGAPEGTVVGASAGGAPGPASGAVGRRIGDERIERYPTMEAPEEVVLGRRFALQVSLTQFQGTPVVRVQPGPGAEAVPGGGLQIKLPVAPNQETWKIDVVVSARGFGFADGVNTRSITLPRHGDSTPAIFHLQADTATPRNQRLDATLWYDGTYLARISRDVAVLSAPALTKRPPAVISERGRAVGLEPHRVTPDLTMFILEAGDGSGSSSIVINSPHLQPLPGFVPDT